MQHGRGGRDTLSMLPKAPSSIFLSPTTFFVETALLWTRHLRSVSHARECSAPLRAQRAMHLDHAQELVELLLLVGRKHAALLRPPHRHVHVLLLPAHSAWSGERGERTTDAGRRAGRVTACTHLHHASAPDPHDALLKSPAAVTLFEDSQAVIWYKNRFFNANTGTDHFQSVPKIVQALEYSIITSILDPLVVACVLRLPPAESGVLVPRLQRSMRKLLAATALAGLSAAMGFTAPAVRAGRCVAG